MENANNLVSLLLSGTALAVAAGSLWASLKQARANEESTRHQLEALQFARRQSDVSMFKDFKNDYLAIKKRMPGFKKIPLEEALNPGVEEAVHDMLVFFDTEFQAQRMGMVSDELWAMWKQGMEEHGLCPHGDRIWCKARHDSRYHDLSDEFVAFYNNLLREGRERKGELTKNGSFPPHFMTDRVIKGSDARA
ncbi:MAG: hypothetical protein H6922_00960 [Pseudomonadaceae bacterium]|nr:hypothetical protein [Pseudomonadaceae bacterium]